MKKALISVVSVVIILAAAFAALIVVPQFIGADYVIETMPTKLEYKLIEVPNADGESSHLKLEAWNLDGLVVAKVNIMGQKQVVEPKDYSLVFPSINLTVGGEYTMFVAITDTKIELPIKFTVIAPEQI